MTKQFEAKVALASGQNPGISRALGDCIGAAYDTSKHGVTGPIRVAAFKDSVSLWLRSSGTSFVTVQAHPLDGARLI